MRIPPELKQPIEQERLLLLSPFEKKHRRMTAALGDQRNQFVASIADDILFIHAAIGSRTEQFLRNSLHRVENIFALHDPGNKNLLGFGAQKFVTPVNAN